MLDRFGKMCEDIKVDILLLMNMKGKGRMSTAEAAMTQRVIVTQAAADEFQKRLSESANKGKVVRVVFQGFA